MGLEQKEGGGREKEEGVSAIPLEMYFRRMEGGKVGMGQGKKEGK